jgi:uncharacterized protein
MRQGLRIFDTDTHVSPSAEALTPYLSSKVRELLPDFDDHLAEITTGWAGEIRERPYKHMFRFASGGGWAGGKPRVLGEADPRTQERHFQHFMGSHFPTEGGDEFAEIRLTDMDKEGTDVHMMVPGGPNGAEDAQVEMEFIRAQHRFLADFCSKDPHRLKSLIVTSARSIEASVAEIHQHGPSSWAVGVQPYMPLDYPIDHPDMDPIFEAAEQEGLTVVHHSFATGYPGYRDLWDNPFIGRSASHPWAAMRFVAAMCGSGILDRHPELRFAVLESGFGWLPFWAQRLDDQAIYVGYVNENLKHKPSEYLTSGRFFASIEMHEGPEILKVVNGLLGDDILMMGSDYPHAESRFPDSVDTVLSWQDNGVTKPALTKLMWDNAQRCFGQP